jgi:hypothetical protein
VKFIIYVKEKKKKKKKKKKKHLFFLGNIYLSCYLSNLLQVSSCTCSNFRLSKDDLLSRTTSKTSNYSSKKLLLRDESRVFTWYEPSQTTGSTPRDQSDFLYWVMAWSQRPRGCKEFWKNLVAMRLERIKKNSWA